MKRIGLMLVAACGWALLVGANAGQGLHFPMHGFSIAPLEGKTTGTNALLMTMFLPPSGGFAANVNVVAQNAPGSLDDYMAASKRGFEQAGFTVIKADKLDDSTAVVEYAGNFQGKSLHWYAKASLKNNEVLLTTATATEQQWRKDADRLRECVDSFKRE
jgi:hypothetical protein